MSVSPGVFTPFVPCPDNLRTWDENGKRIATLEKVDGKVVAIPYYGPDSGLHLAKSEAGEGADGRKERDAVPRTSGLDGTNIGEYYDGEDNRERKASFLKFLFGGNKNKDIVVDKTNGVNRSAVIHGNLAKSIYK